MFSHICYRCFSRGARSISVATACLILCGVTQAQTVAASSRNGDALTILKIDPPNWWATLPKPMLLVQGTGLHDATFTLSDPALHIEEAIPSDNGHYTQLWLSASPTVAKTVTLTARLGASKVDAPYAFLPRRAPSEGFAGFSSRDLMYLIMTDRFADGDPANDGPTGHDAVTSPAAAAERAKPRGWHGGDLLGIQQHLDYLQQLGVTAVWPTPVYQNHGTDSYHGYGATDMYAVDEHYGTLADLKSLAAALHARHMKLVLDTVPNHIGPNNPWVADEPAPNWFHGTKAHHLNAESNFNALIDPHASDRDRVGTLTGWFAGVLPDMNTDDPTVALYLRQNAIWWIESTGADALRIDTFPYVNREFWHDFNGELKTLYPNLTEVGEAFNPDPVIVSSFADGVTRARIDTRLYTPFDFPTFFALRNVFAPGPAQSGFKPDAHTEPGKLAPMSKLTEVLAADALYPHPERLVTFVGNHDTSRILTATNSEALVRLGFAYIFTTRGMPQLYSGDEIAMTGGDDPDNRHDFPGGFPNATSAFTPETRTPNNSRCSPGSRSSPRSAKSMTPSPAVPSKFSLPTTTGSSTSATPPTPPRLAATPTSASSSPSTAPPSQPPANPPPSTSNSPTPGSQAALWPHPHWLPPQPHPPSPPTTLHLQLLGNEALIAACR